MYMYTQKIVHVYTLGIPTFLNEKSAETTPFLDILPKLPKLDIFASFTMENAYFLKYLDATMENP